MTSKKVKLWKKIDMDFNRIKDELNGKIDSNFDDLLNFLTPLSKDMLQTMNGCVVKDPQRVDLITEYIDYLHEKICEIIATFWDSNHDAMDSVNLLKLSSWMHRYSEQLKDFFADVSGIRTLLEIYINRSIESVESVVQGIVDYEKTRQPYANEDN